jgi:hypothetical protein
MEKTEGNCYFCGKELKHVAMKNHLIKSHCGEGDEPCLLMIIEGSRALNYHYWIIVDAALDKSLTAVDSFLRKIWLECCGHMSGFRDHYDGVVGKAWKIGDFAPGDKIYHMYDFGTTTVVRISFLAETVRPKQKAAVRLLARNIPPAFKCTSCGGTATQVCCECGGAYNEAFFCDRCLKKHECGEDMGLPVTNSPRCGECGYCGENDVFGFRPVMPRPISSGRPAMVWTSRP